MRQWTVDAFAAAPFKGNPACIVEPFDAWPDAAWMQALAAENNQAETAYLLRTADPARFGLRWFTPATEVDLCGHATLAAARSTARSRSKASSAGASPMRRASIVSFAPSARRIALGCCSASASAASSAPRSAACR